MKGQVESTRTRFSYCRPSTARVILAAGLLFSLYAAFAIEIPAGNMQGGGDAVSLRYPIITLMRDGYGYYDATELVLRQRGAPLRPFYCWRLPWLVILLSHLPDVASRGLLIALYGAAAAVWARGLRRSEAAVAVLGMLPLMVLAGSGILFTWYDLWVGALIGLSLGLRPYSRWASLLTGLLPLALRVHAGVYVLIMAGYALHERRWKELCFWAGGLLLFAAQLGLHAWLVSARVSEADPQRIAAAGGLGVLLATLKLGPLYTWFHLSALNGLTLAAVLVGAFGRRDTRLAAVLLGFFTVFFLAGHRVNWYWGLMCGPLLAAAFALAIPATVDLFRVAFCLRTESGR